MNGLKQLPTDYWEKLGKSLGLKPNELTNKKTMLKKIAEKFNLKKEVSGKDTETVKQIILEEVEKQEAKEPTLPDTSLEGVVDTLNDDTKIEKEEVNEPVNEDSVTNESIPSFPSLLGARGTNSNAIGFQPLVTPENNESISDESNEDSKEETTETKELENESVEETNSSNQLDEEGDSKEESNVDEHIPSSDNYDIDEYKKICSDWGIGYSHDDSKDDILRYLKSASIVTGKNCPLPLPNYDDVFASIQQAGATVSTELPFNTNQAPVVPATTIPWNDEDRSSLVKQFEEPIIRSITSFWRKMNRNEVVDLVNAQGIGSKFDVVENEGNSKEIRLVFESGGSIPSSEEEWITIG